MVIAIWYSAISAIWSFLMCLSLFDMVWVSIFGDLNTGDSAFGAFEILSVLGMLWIPAAVIAALCALRREEAKKIPWRKNWSFLAPLGHCLYYAALVAVPSLVQPILPRVFDHHYSFPIVMSAAALYLLLLGVANSIQVYRLFKIAD